MAKSDETDIVVRLGCSREGWAEIVGLVFIGDVGRSGSVEKVGLQPRVAAIQISPSETEKRDTDSRNPGIGSPATHVTRGEKKTATLVGARRNDERFFNFHHPSNLLTVGQVENSWNNFF